MVQGLLGGWTRPSILSFRLFFLLFFRIFSSSGFCFHLVRFQFWENAFQLRLKKKLSVPMMYPSLHLLLSNCYLPGTKKGFRKRTINAVESLYILLLNSYLQTTRYYSNSQMYFLCCVFMVVSGLFNSSFPNGLNLSTILFEVYIVILLSRMTML